MPAGAVRATRPTERNIVDLHAVQHQVPVCSRSGEDLRQVVLAANADGIDLLRRGHPVMAFEQLKYAEAVLVANPDISAGESELLALTCSNLGCYYRKAGLPRASLLYLGRALRAEKAAAHEMQQDACALATTKLNACAALSGVERHEEAEKLAVEAMQLLVPQDGTTPSREECALLAVACHNLGAEREHLGRWSGAAVAYRQGAEVARKVLGPKSPMTRTLADHCARALTKAERNPFLPRRPAGIRRRPRTGKSKVGAGHWSPGRGFMLPGQGGSELLPSQEASTEERQGEEPTADVPLAESAGAQQELGAGSSELEEGGAQPTQWRDPDSEGFAHTHDEAATGEEEDDFEVRDRFLPSLSQPPGPDHMGHMHSTFSMDGRDGGPQQPRNTVTSWGTGWGSPANVRRWSTSESSQSLKPTSQQQQQQQQQQPRQSRYTHAGALTSLGSLPEVQEVSGWPATPHPNNLMPQDQVQQAQQVGRQGVAGSVRGRSASTMNVMTMNC